GGDYWVDVDNVEGGRVATRHLVDRGYRRIAMITGPPTMRVGVDRLAGYREVLAGAGLEAAGVEDGGFTAVDAEAAMPRILDDGSAPDAVFIASDLMARGALGAIARRGLRVPEDIAIVGFDDSPVAARVTPPLTTVRQPSREQGAVMADVLIRRLAG